MNATKEGHLYRVRLDGGAEVQYPSITEVLRQSLDYGFLSDQDRDYYLSRGSALHRALALLDGVEPGKTLNMRSLAEELRPFVRAYKEFKRDCRVEIELVEHQVVSQSLGFAGTLDRYGKVTGRRALWDIKTGEAIHPADGLQLAAYARALYESERIKGPIARYSVHLHNTGRYRLVHWTAEDEDYAVFIAHLTVWKWREKHGLNRRRDDG